MLSSASAVDQDSTRFSVRFEGLQLGLLAKRRLLLGLTLVLVLGALPATGLLRTDLRAIEFLAPDSRARQAMVAIDAEMGGMNLFQLEVDFIMDFICMVFIIIRNPEIPQRSPKESVARRKGQNKHLHTISRRIKIWTI